MSLADGLAFPAGGQSPRSAPRFAPAEAAKSHATFAGRRRRKTSRRETRIEPTHRSRVRQDDLSAARREQPKRVVVAVGRPRVGWAPPTTGAKVGNAHPTGGPSAAAPETDRF